jgi:hypothetical protein
MLFHAQPYFALRSLGPPASRRHQIFAGLDIREWLKDFG